MDPCHNHTNRDSSLGSLREIFLSQLFIDQSFYDEEARARAYKEACKNLNHISIRDIESLFYKPDYTSFISSAACWANERKLENEKQRISELWKNVSKGEIELKDVGIGVTGSKFVYTSENQKTTYHAILKTMRPPANNLTRTLEINIKKLSNQHRPTDNLIHGDVRFKMIAEVACCILANKLNFNQAARKAGGYDIVPPTTIAASLKQKQLHSMQLFVPNAFVAQTVFDKHSTDPRIQKFQSKLEKLEKLNLYAQFESAGFSINEIKLFQLFTIFDFFIGNQDRHNKNWLIILNDEGSLIGIVAIDNGNAFPAKHLTEGQSVFIEPNQYAWAECPLSKIILLPDIKELIHNITEKTAEHFWLGTISVIDDAFYTMCKHVKDNIECIADFKLIEENERQEGLKVIDDFMNSDEMKICLRDRIHVLKSNIIRCPADLANYKTERQFTEFYNIKEGIVTPEEMINKENMIEESSSQESLINRFFSLWPFNKEKERLDLLYDGFEPEEYEPQEPG